MFDFEKLEVYQKAKKFNCRVYDFLQEKKAIDYSARDQLRRASLSIMLNIAEGSSRFSKADRRHFFVISRGSAFECVAIFDFFHEQKFLTTDDYKEYCRLSEELSKILFAMIRNLEK